MDFRSVADDFFVQMDLQTTVDLPRSRETVLHFCEAIQKQFPSMTTLYQRQSGEFVLEGDRESGSYLWVEFQARRLSAGYFNPPNVAEACNLHRWLLQGSVYFLGIGKLDVEALDVMFGFNMDCASNRDQIVADAVLAGSAIGTFSSGLSGHLIECEPSIVVALDEGGSTQARLSIETRANNLQPNAGKYDDEPIGVYLTIRKYPRPGHIMDLEESFDQQQEMCEDIACESVVPNVINPISAAIAAAQ